MLVLGRLVPEGKRGFLLTGNARFKAQGLNSIGLLIIFGGAVVNYHDT